MRGIAIGLGLIALIATSDAAAEIARIKTSSGTATVVRGSQKLKPAPGLQLEARDTLVTGKDGRMAVTFIDNTRFAVGPNSSVSVSEFQYDRTQQKGAMVTQVDRGSLAVVSGKIAKSNRDAMKVRTPNTLLGVRGTKFIVEVPQ
ncbi:FecR family protein [Sphingomonas alba]|uniref:FecR family protein n=1 Tax=Sphingomonas alba TaxID=2908208 RepID=A0ABT0RQ78_9SPHN|nr:FecR family protein [Sphingomonas alba]